MSQVDSQQLTLKQIAKQQSATSEVMQSIADRVISEAKKLGAEQTEVWSYNTIGNSLEVRNGELETLEFNQDSHLGINLYVQQRKGTVSINDLTEAAALKGLEAAFNIAKYTEPDPYAGLVEADRMATEFKDLSLDHPFDLSLEDMLAVAQEGEAAALKHKEIKQSEGANFYSHRSLSSYANSHGFRGLNQTTRYSLSNVLIGETEKGMIRDGYYTLGRDFNDLLLPAEVGEAAAERIKNKLIQGKCRSGQYPVVFSPEVARGLWSHLLSALKGGALYQRSSFMLDKLGHKILPDFISINEDPFLLKGLGSSNYDSDGVATQQRTIVGEGILNGYFLSGYSARRLGMETTGNAGGIHNISIDSEKKSLDSILKDLGTGLLVTEVMGQGVNIVTGNYSRGASGFWFENGVIQHYVQEITIAGNLEQMLQSIVSMGSDVDKRSSILTGSVAIERMTVAA
ncbi:metalloprotease PmbA [Kangiella sediminilitoris]|uniref:Peptidase U62 modulator of DNA gyrase n=1 Tax=Kangiella sediminilitoris TaxID=1144748 RepID=A0A1B3BCH4_9GAMM|nr:metalloprotease PmbA [Kangiella sediminilitoris]AOE50509.1 Peptidase U62 modulator of DNA gyrase [Kangiella sediminilitoris]